MVGTGSVSIIPPLSPVIVPHATTTRRGLWLIVLTEIDDPSGRVEGIEQIFCVLLRNGGVHVQSTVGKSGELPLRSDRVRQTVQPLPSLPCGHVVTIYSVVAFVAQQTDLQLAVGPFEPVPLATQIVPSLLPRLRHHLLPCVA